MCRNVVSLLLEDSTERINQGRIKIEGQSKKERHSYHNGDLQNLSSWNQIDELHGKEKAECPSWISSSPRKCTMHLNRALVEKHLLNHPSPTLRLMLLM